MNISKASRSLVFLAAATSIAAMSGCATYEVNTDRGSVPGYFIRSEMQQADRAVEAAHQAGKDQICPAAYQAAVAARDNAYDVFRACHTEEGVALAKQATRQANALCPPQAPREMPVVREVPAPEPAPAPVPVPAVAPTDSLMVTPGSITRGEAATLNWTSQNATACDIEPGIGPVQPQGSLAITPADSTMYNLTCRGAGGVAKSAAGLAVVAPVVAAPAPKLCSPTVIDIQFDTNKSDIKPKYHDELKKLADFLVEFPKARGVVEGHTDSVGDKASNMKLSQRRADSVRSYLIKTFGVAPERLEAKGYGPSKPRASNKTAAGKAQNRRIEANFICD